MDPSRFDHLTQRLAESHASRRGLRGLLALALVGVLGRQGVNDAAANGAGIIRRVECRVDAHCRRGVCDRRTGRCFCLGRGKRCAARRQCCCRKLTCRDRTCQPVAPKRRRCGRRGQACCGGRRRPCRGALRCRARGKGPRCLPPPPPACGGEGQPCCGEQGRVCGGQCIACPPGQAVNPTTCACECVATFCCSCFGISEATQTPEFTFCRQDITDPVACVEACREATAGGFDVIFAPGAPDLAYVCDAAGLCSLTCDSS